MKKPVKPLVIAILLVLSLLALAACEKERPAPKAATTAPGTPGTRAPALQALTPLAPTGAAGTTAGTRTTAGGAAAGAGATNATPAPPTPPPLNQPAAGQGTPQGGTTSTGTAQSWSYTVQGTDTLNAIAKKFNTTPEAIIALNPTLTPNVLAIGQQLKIPGEAPPEYGGYARYTVQSGDTLNSIATKYNTTAQNLQTINNIQDPTQLQVGQVLKVPGSAAAAPAASGSGTAAGTGTGSGTAAGTGAGSGSGAGAVVTVEPPTQSYTVQRGDTLASIAVRFGTTVANLQALNNLANPDALRAGQALKVPGPSTGSGTGSSTGSGTGTRSYVVQPGDTLTAIARRYGVTVNALMQANGITNPNLVRTGQRLVIP